MSKGFVYKISRLCLVKFVCLKNLLGGGRNQPKYPTLSWERLSVYDLDISTKQRMYEIYKKVYTNDFNVNTMLNKITQVVLTTEGRKIVGCASLCHNRILWVGIDTDFANQGYGKALFKNIKSAVPDSWISVGIDHPKVIATALKSGFKLIKIPSRINFLFESVGKKKTVAYSSQLDDSLNDLTNSNIPDNPLVGFSKLPENNNEDSNFGHGNKYIQIVLSAKQL